MLFLLLAPKWASGILIFPIIFGAEYSPLSEIKLMASPYKFWPYYFFLKRSE